MKWDAGALSPNRNKSPIFRFLSSNPPRWERWPHKSWQEALMIFAATPGITEQWMIDNFGFTRQRMESLYNRLTPRHYELGRKNVLTATHQDALMYMKNRRLFSQTPAWVEPFIMDDKKQGMTWNDIRKKWRLSNYTLERILRSGGMSNVFRTGI